MRTVAISNNEVEEFIKLVGGTGSKWGQRLMSSYGIYVPGEAQWPRSIPMPNPFGNPHVLIYNGDQPSGIKYL